MNEIKYTSTIRINDFIKTRNHDNNCARKDYPEVQYTIKDMILGDVFDFNMNNLPNYEVLKTLVTERATFRFGANFKFRPYQLDSIISIILSFFDKDNFIIEAPTGSGKSITGLLVADTLNYYFNLCGYILVSDLGLLDQYAHDIDAYFPDFAILKGQDNYICNENKLAYPFGVCKMMSKSYTDIDNMECSIDCPYINARRKAISAPVVLMTYQAWLIHRNYVPALMMNSSHKGAHPFHQREFTICDEAHKLAEIIQDHFSPIINKFDFNRLADIAQRADGMIGNITCVAVSPDPLHYKKYIDTIFAADDNDVIYDALTHLYNAISHFGELENAIKEYIGKKNANKPTKRQVLLMKDCDWAREFCCKIEDYVNMIKDTGTWAIVKSDIDGMTIKLNCIDERYLIKEHFHLRCGNRLYMSATIGEPTNYVNSISSENNRFVSVPTTFDFSRSPIYYDNEYKLSYDKRAENLPKIINKIIKIIRDHGDVKGIIQTGSYQFATELMNNLPDDLKSRVLMYADSKDKEFQIDDYKNSKNKVLIGPSLLEGIDLKDDLCRFIIVMKIPYPSLGDKFTERKFKSNPQWYIWKTVNSLIQGIGRGVRNENDWCETYILDATMDNILLRNRNLIPQHILMRMINVASNQ